jgi:uncharacterized protein (TIGR03382 family)
MKVALRRQMARAFVLAPVVFLMVAGAGCPSLFESSTHRATRIRQAEVGRDGAFTVPAANTVVNLYAQLAGAADPVAGNTAITVTDVNANFLGAVSQGDLLLIVQMAGATIKSDLNDATYGAVTSLGNAGHYEFVGVEGVAGGGVITLACGLKNGYSRSGKTQVIRVPQYTTLTIGSGTSITALAWDGFTGGVVAVHAETTLQLDGQIDVSAKGFQGGAAPAAKTTAAAGSGIVLYSSATETNGAQKGESIAGYQSDYNFSPTNGQYGRGAPANGGGGGDSHNAGGGGGANARSGAAWTGQGVMLNTVVGAAAWVLDPGDINNPAGANTLTHSEGGGRGGYSYSNAALDPLAVGPNPAGGTWLGDNRREVGGLGGHPLDNDPASLLFLGGGGGAGDGNNGVAGPGGRGGGLIFLIAGTISGGGSIHANGGPGGSSTGAAGAAGDAAGGGGGGGTVVVHAVSITGISGITADGGVGGNHTNGTADEVEGPGGGGGGGYIAVSGGTPPRSAAGGLGGTTTVTGSVMSTYPSNGATAGNAGQTTGDATSFRYCGIASPAAPVTVILTHPTDPSTSSTGVFTFEAAEAGVTEAGVTLGQGAVTFKCSLDGAVFVPCVPGYTTPVLSDGAHTFSVQATDLSGNVESSPPTFTWTVQANALGLDGGVDAEPQAVDLGVDGGGEAASAVLLDAESVDAFANEDLLMGLDAAEPDLSDDTIFRDGIAPIVGLDAAKDAEGADLLPILLDAGNPTDTKEPAAEVANADLPPNAQPSDAEPNPDTASAAEPNPDTAGPVAKDDAATTPANKDAALGAEDLKLRGAGFCAIASPRSTSSAPYMMMALAALAVLRRRRKS